MQTPLRSMVPIAGPHCFWHSGKHWNSRVVGLGDASACVAPNPSVPAMPSANNAVLILVLFNCASWCLV
jgi:hypothetical protein